MCHFFLCHPLFEVPIKLVVLITRDMFIRLGCRLIEHMSYHDCYLNTNIRRLSQQLNEEMMCPLCLGYAPK